MVNSLIDGMNFFLALLSTLPVSIVALFTFIVGVNIIAFIAKKVSE